MCFGRNMAGPAKEERYFKTFPIPFALIHEGMAAHQFAVVGCENHNGIVVKSGFLQCRQNTSKLIVDAGDTGEIVFDTVSGRLMECR